MGRGDCGGTRGLWWDEGVGRGDYGGMRKLVR